MVLAVVSHGGLLLATNQITPGSLMSFLVATQTIQRSVEQWVNGLLARVDWVIMWSFGCVVINFSHLRCSLFGLVDNLEPNPHSLGHWVRCLHQLGL